MTPDAIASLAISAVAGLIRAGLVAAEQREQAEHVAITEMRQVGPDVAADYHAALAARERSDADEVLRRRDIRDGLLGLASRESAPVRRDTVPAPPDTLRILDPHDHDDGEG